MNHNGTDPLAHRGAVIASGVAAAIGALALVGWAVGSQRLTALARGLPEMNPVTAFYLIGASAALFLLQSEKPGNVRKIIGRGLAAALIGVAAAKLVSLSAHLDWPVDTWLFSDKLNSTRIPSRMALRAAIDFVLLGSALLLLEVRTPGGVRPAEILTALAAIIAFLALFGYSYGLITLYRSPTYEPMSLPGTIAFIAVAVGILLARTDAGAMRIIVSDTSAGLLARLLLPLVFLLPLVLGALRLVGENAGLYSSRAGVALFATTFVVLFVIAIWRATRALFETEMARRAAVEHVRELNAELEQRVAARTAELNVVNEELRRASAAKDEFLAVLSHELRTPLTPALAAASYLADHAELPPELREEVGGIRANIQLEARLIDDLLDLTHITRGNIQLQLETVDAHELVRKTLEIVHADIREQQLDVVIDFCARDHHVRVDPVRLQQVFWNLINNTVKFTSKGGRITIRSSSEGRRFALEITDTGMGIDPKEHGRLFEAFAQGDASTNRRFGGLGLGLTISKKLLDLHGGTITVRSGGKDRGVSFKVTLAAVPAPALESTSPSAPAAARPGRQLDLLLVDDHAQTLRVLSILLRKRGHKVATADSVQSALKLLDSARFDAVISDIGLPDGTGCDVMRAAKERQALPGIALSGYGMDEDIRRSKEAGFAHHLTKPVDFKELEIFLGAIS